MTTCPECKHPVSEHYGGCMVEDEDSPTGYCQCDEQFNLATGMRYPNRSELIALLERAAEHLGNNPLATEITSTLRGEEDTTSSAYHDRHCIRCAVCRECMDCNLRPCVGGAEHVAQEAA